MIRCRLIPNHHIVMTSGPGQMSGTKKKKKKKKKKHYQKIMWHTCLHAFILPRTLTWRVKKWIYALNMPPSNTHSQSLTHTTHTHTYSDVSHTHRQHPPLGMTLRARLAGTSVGPSSSSLGSMTPSKRCTTCLGFTQDVFRLGYLHHNSEVRAMSATFALGKVYGKSPDLTGCYNTV